MRKTKIDVLGVKVKVVYGGELSDEDEGQFCAATNTITVRTENRTKAQIQGTLSHEWFHALLSAAGLSTIDPHLEEVLAASFERSLPGLLRQIKNLKIRNERKK